MGIDWIDGVRRRTDHRPFPLSKSPWMMTMSWVDLLAAHWPVDPEAIEEYIPDELILDTRDGDAWLTVVPFVMDDVLPRGLTWWVRPFRFPELNVRTYVTVDGDYPGVWFFSLDAASRLAVSGARRVFSLPYFHADMSVDSRGDATHYRSRRTHRGAPDAQFTSTYGPDGEIERAEPGSLDYWLMERYCLYTKKGGSVYRCDVHHHRWPLRPAITEIETNTLFDDLELDLPDQPPVAHYADRIDVLGWGLKDIDAST